MSEKITVKKGKLIVSDQPIIPVIIGDGIGQDITPAMQQVVNAAVEKKYQGKRKIEWKEVLAGEKAVKEKNDPLPEETLNILREHIVSIKGPLTTPVGSGIRSLNVAIRQKLDLYACIRPIHYFQGVPSPVKHPEKLNVVIFRENTEDVYAGIEWQQGTVKAKKIIKFLHDEMGKIFRKDSGIGIKPISITGTKRLVDQAIHYAIDNNRKSITLVHKGNIMKYTEGSFRDWGYEVAQQDFPEQIITEKDLWDKYNGQIPPGKIVIKDRIADAMFQQVLLRPDEYDVIATTNLNGDYLSDACAAQVGGLGLAPGANIGEAVAVFEATHGTAPKYAGQNKVNPGSIILSAEMMLRYMGWTEAAEIIIKAIQKTISQKTVTYDLERQMQGATLLSTSGFAEAIVKNL